MARYTHYLEVQFYVESDHKDIEDIGMYTFSKGLFEKAQELVDDDHHVFRLVETVDESEFEDEEEDER